VPVTGVEGLQFQAVVGVTAPTTRPSPSTTGKALMRRRSMSCRASALLAAVHDVGHVQEQAPAQGASGMGAGEVFGGEAARLQ